MAHVLSAADLEVLKRTAGVRAHQLRRRYALNRDDVDDVRQDLMADFLGRLPAFDPRRGTLGAFAGRIMANRAYAIARDICRRRQLHGAEPVSLDAPVDAAGIVPLGELVPEEAGLSAMLGYWIDPIAAVERRLDLERALALLDDKSRSLVAALLRGSAHLLARTGLGSRSALYRQLRDLRLALLAAGITSA